MADIYDYARANQNNDPNQVASANNQLQSHNWLTDNASWLTPIATTTAQIAYNMYANDRNNKFNADEAKKQRDYETYMSNTAYQRAYADMKAAGLNPHLAGGQGGASTPSGSAAATTGMMPMNMDSTLNAALTHAQLSNIEADTSMKNKQSGKTQKETDYVENKIGLETALNEVQQELIRAQTKDAKKAAQQKQQLLINQMIQNYYEFTTGRKMPTGMLDSIYGKVDYLLSHAENGSSQSADALYQIIKAEIDNYNKGDKK